MAVAKSLKALLLGNPVSVSHRVVPVELLAKLQELEVQAALNGALFFGNALSNLPTGVEGNIGFVLNDPTPALNGIYRKNASAWARTAALPGAFTDAVASIAALDAFEVEVETALGSKAPLASPTFTGTVAGVTKGHVGLGSVDNTSDAGKPISTAQAAAIALKADIASPTFTGTVGGVTKAHVGLGSADNTSDAGKPVSTATQTALDAKSPLASPTFTGTVAGVTKAHVGLSNVDNTTDAGKPISTAAQTALDTKSPLASPTFTGTVAGVTKAMVGLGNADNTTDALKPLSTAAQTALYSAPQTSGNIRNFATANSGSSNGATIGSVGGRARTIGIPIGQTGQSTFITPMIQIAPLVANELAGATVRVTISMAANLTTFLADRPFEGASSRVEYHNGTAVSTSAGSNVLAVQSGNTITRSVDLLFTGAESRFGQAIQIGAGDAATTAETLTVADVRWGVIAAPEGKTVEDLNRICFGAEIVSQGDEFRTLAFSGQNLNGATIIKDGIGRNVGLTFPVGQQGDSSFIRTETPFSAREFALTEGGVIRVEMTVALSNPFSASITPLFQSTDLNGNRQTVTPKDQRAVNISNQAYKIFYDITPTAAMYDLQPYVQFQNASNITGTPQTATLVDQRIYLIDHPDKNTSLDERNRRWMETRRDARGAMLADQTLRGVVGDVIELTPSDDLAAAMLAAKGTASRPVILSLAPGVYPCVQPPHAAHLSIVGPGPETCEIRCWQANDVGNAAVIANSALNQHSGLIQGVRVSTKNGRYALHPEKAGLLPNEKLVLRNCEFVHLGNAGADAENGSEVWASAGGIGCGMSGGQHIYVEDCLIQGKSRGGGFHTALRYTHPARLEFTRVHFQADDADGYGVIIQPHGSGTPDIAIFNDCTANKQSYWLPVPWQESSMSYQPANHMGEFRIVGGRNALTFRLNDTGRALTITSNSTGTGSSIVVSGTAVPILLGATDLLTTRAGFAGASARVVGYNDIQDVSSIGQGDNTKMGVRLGNRVSLGAVSLTVVTDGGTPQTISFDSNYTGSSNTTILGIINAVLTGSTASITTPGNDSRPRFTGQEMRLKNSGTNFAPIGSVMAYDGSEFQAELMTSAMASSLFAGVALEDIAPGAAGRVQVRGWINLEHVRRIGGASVPYNSTFGIDASNPGAINASGTGLLRVVRSSDGVGRLDVEIATY